MIFIQKVNAGFWLVQAVTSPNKFIKSQPLAAGTPL